MSHQTLFAKFDKMKIVGHIEFVGTRKYKDTASAIGTIGKAASEYRKERNEDFYVSCSKLGNSIRVVRVKNGKKKEDYDMIGTVQSLTPNVIIKTDFPHNSELYISALKTILAASMKPFNDFVKL